MASPASKSMSADVAAAIAEYEAKKSVAKLPIAAASNLKKSKYIGKKALAGVVQRFGYAPGAYQG